MLARGLPCVVHTHFPFPPAGTWHRNLGGQWWKWCKQRWKQRVVEAPIRNTSCHTYVNENYALLVLCMGRNHAADVHLLLCHFCFIISWLVRKTQRDLYGSYFWIALCQTWWYLLGENWGRPLFNCGVGFLYDGENEGTDILGYYIQISFIHVRFKKNTLRITLKCSHNIHKKH